MSKHVLHKPSDHKPLMKWLAERIPSFAKEKAKKESD